MTVVLASLVAYMAFRLEFPWCGWIAATMAGIRLGAVLWKAAMFVGAYKALEQEARK